MADGFTFKLTTEGKKFQKELGELAKLAVYVGYQQGKHYYEDPGTGRKVDMADIAMFNEVGTARAPSRPFLRDSINNHEQELSTFMQGLVKEVVEGSSAANVLAKLGEYQKRAIQTEIRDGNFIPNKDSTIAKKGSDRPLIDTGQMRQSVGYIVKEAE